MTEKPSAPKPESDPSRAPTEEGGPAAPESWSTSLKKITPVDGLIALALIGLVFTFLIPRWADQERVSNEGAAIVRVRALGQAQKEFHDKQPDKHYAGTFLELAAGGADLGGDIEAGKLEQNGYVYRLGLLDESGTRYFILAQPIRFGETGARSLYMDDTGILRGSPGPVVGPAFPEVS